MVIANCLSSSYTELDQSDWVIDDWCRVVTGFIYRANGSDVVLVGSSVEGSAMVQYARLEGMVERAIRCVP